MHPRYLRPLLIVEFLLALQVVISFWSHVGGQYHLDLMFWPWKFGVSVAAAALITGVTAEFAAADGSTTTRAVFYGSLLLATIVVAGVTTYYYHLHEPSDDERDTADEPSLVSCLRRHRERPDGASAFPRVRADSSARRAV